MHGRLSLQDRLVVLMVAAILPLSVLSVWFAVREVDLATRQAQSQLQLAASLVAAHQDRMVEGAQQLLEAVAAQPGLYADPAACGRYFRDLRSRLPVYANLGLFDVQGRAICHALPEQAAARGPLSVDNAAQFASAVRAGRFVVGEMRTGRMVSEPVLPFLQPVLEGGEIKAIAFAALNLGKASTALALPHLPAGASLMVTDSHGHVLAQHPVQQGAPLGRVAQETLAWAESGAPRGSGELQQGERTRLYAFARSRPTGGAGYLATVTQDKAMVTAALWAIVREQVLALGLTLLAGVMAAWWLGARFIVKPARRILGAVRRLEQGRLEVRVPMDGEAGRGEFGRIAAAFNVMAESLALRRRELETELSHSRSAHATLDMVINSLQEGLIAADTGGRFLMFNKAAERLFPLDAGQVGELPLDRANRGESGSCLVHVRSERMPQGRLLQCSYQPLMTGEGVSGGMVLFTDVTELHRAEADMREYTAMLQRSAEAAKLITLQHTLESVLHVVAHQARDVIGADAAHITLACGRQAQAGGGQTLLASQARLVVPLVDLDGRNSGQLCLMGPAGRPFNQHDEYVAIELAQLASIAIQNVRLLTQVRELNASLESRIEQRTAELVRQERLFRTLAEEAPAVIWNTDAHGNAMYINRAWCNLVGGEPRQWLGQAWLERMHPDDVPELRAKWKHSQDTLQAYSGVRRILGQGGAWHTMSYKGAPVLDDLGRIEFWVGIDADISELVATEQALRTSNQELEAFSYSVSHDLRAPLGAIGGFSRALSNKLEEQLDERGRHYLARIQAGVDKMEQLIDALLSLAQVVRTPVSWCPVDLSALALEAFEGLGAAAPQRSVECVVQPGLTAHGDARLLRIALDNLLGNAWKFTSRQPKARIEVGQVDAMGPFFVRDNGVGFDMAYSAKLFSPFQRLHADKDFPGTGVGLATVQRIISRHQGRVWAESEPGRGAAFFFTLA